MGLNERVTQVLDAVGREKFDRAEVNYSEESADIRLRRRREGRRPHALRRHTVGRRSGYIVVQVQTRGATHQRTLMKPSTECFRVWAERYLFEHEVPITSSVEEGLEVHQALEKFIETDFVGSRIGGHL